jgi:hypothetical protein
MCGNFGGDDGCDHRELFSFLGDQSNGHAPFQINFNFLDEDDATRNAGLFDYDAAPCNETAQVP